MELSFGKQLGNGTFCLLFDQFGIHTSLTLPVVAAVVGNNTLNGDDGTFDHSVIGLKNSQVLEPNTGQRDDACEQIIVSTCKLDQLITNTYDDGQECEFDEHTPAKGEHFPTDRCGNWINKEGNKNTDKKHQNQKGSTATGMKTLLQTYIFHGERKSCLVAENGLMLGTVEHISAANILHQGNSRHISYQENDLKNALDGGFPNGIEHKVIPFNKGCYQSVKEGGQKNKETNCETKAENHA